MTEAARNFSDLINRVYYRREATTLLKNGKPVARVVPAEAVLKTGRELAVRLAGRRPRLTVREAAALEADLLAARKAMPPPVSKWD